MSFISFACMYPAERQAQILSCDRSRRHPYGGKRPEWSGYCVIGSCACECHRGPRVCANCGGPLNAIRASKRYCSDVCRRAASKAL
jgi:hypothetical protein